MKNYDLSILIPARNEMFLSKTVEDILRHKTGNTEIIVGLDGEWADPGVVDHPDVRILYVSESIGQRAMTNTLCRLSTAKYVMKLDAHCSMAKGFDTSMLEAYSELPDGESVTMVPIMRNLWAFDWICPDGHTRYQGPSGPCEECGKPTERKMMWIANPKRPHNTSYRFDNTLHFQYFPEYKKRQKGDLVETMSLQGSCFMMTRAKYWELDICDEDFGSWGQQGTEVACKTWLSGGRVLCNTRTEYMHLFRTQGKDFGFPYKQDQSQVDHARQYSRDLFLNNTWPKAIHPLSWLINKFAPVPGWDVSKGLLYYTDNRLDPAIMKKVQDQIFSIVSDHSRGYRIVSVSLKPTLFGDNFVMPLEPGYLSMFKQILKGLEELKTDVVFFCEHDVLYHATHFDFIPPRKDMFYYNQNFWKVWPDGFAAHWDANQVSGLCCYREHAINYYRARIAEVERDGFNRSYEPGGRDKSQYEVWKSRRPNVDIRHDGNLTKSHRSIDDFRDKSTAVNFKESTIDKVPGWPKLPEILK
jgi:hypothetical protein